MEESHHHHLLKVLSSLFLTPKNRLACFVHLRMVDKVASPITFFTSQWMDWYCEGIFYTNELHSKDRQSYKAGRNSMKSSVKKFERCQESTSDISIGVDPHCHTYLPYKFSIIPMALLIFLESQNQMFGFEFNNIITLDSLYERLLLSLESLTVDTIVASTLSMGLLGSLGLYDVDIRSLWVTR